MNGIQNRKGQNIEKFPGCLGRMVNLFDFNLGVPRNSLLSDKPHRDDGSSLTRSQSDLVRMASPTFGDLIEDKAIVSELRRTLSNKKGNGTAMKMLIAKEMSKEVESKRDPPNVVAKLMGLDSIPKQKHNLAAQRCHCKGPSRRSLSQSDIPREGWEQGQVFSAKQMQCEGNLCQELNKYKDVYEIWQQSSRTTNTRDSSPHTGSYNDNVNEKRMALVRQKFMEAKHLVTDEKLRQTKEFKDALEVLSSNRELFLKFLEEPNSTFSQYLYNFQSLTPETKHITVLRPSMMVDKEKLSGIGNKGDKQTKKAAQMGQVTRWDRNNTACYPPFPGPNVDEYSSQPTRIVVLKPSLEKTQDIQTAASPSFSSPRLVHREDSFEEPEDDGVREQREVAKEITRQMQENMMHHRREETLFSSVFSNGYIGDDSSFNRSENDCAVENLSDSEVMSPTSRHSWDYINRFGSPYSSSSFSRASCSPESSVRREAKKRLSERWALMASNKSSQEQRQVVRRSSTLGEMLALSDTNKLVKSEEAGNNKEQESEGSTSCITLHKEESTSDSPKNHLRSIGPLSSTAYGGRLEVEVPDPGDSKEQGSKEVAKAKSMKSTLKGKVSSLFFSKNKKTSKQKSSGSQATDVSPSATPGTPGSPIIHPRKISSNASQCVDTCNQECFSETRLPDLTSMGQKQGMISFQAGLSVAKTSMAAHLSENQEQPSPISVLKPPFDEEENTIHESSGSFKSLHGGLEVPLKSNLIDKSPPIESIARILSWGDSCSETASNFSTVSPGAKEEEQDWVLSVQSLLSAVALNGEVTVESFRWHSLESPLDPSLRDKHANLNAKEPRHESKRRQWRSMRKLVFDCVNAALLEITGSGSNSCVRTLSLGRGQTEGDAPMLVDQVWSRMKELFSSEVICRLDSDDLVVQKEVVRETWGDEIRLEKDSLGREIEGKLLEELVEEAVVWI
ncbi:TON1 Recruiting Motif 20 [Hibiscus trionum]|uniref:TON1 Recruiting Motif 20 n=1 Tax=Hibiscus trionum TaxID=183268 RepID=A0A9W7H9P8_HIBTR|nr:TON1 Recruiting Motif 20 [Hibiscus trionum]